jgi:hypothetical protein
MLLLLLLVLVLVEWIFHDRSYIDANVKIVIS